MSRFRLDYSEIEEYIEEHSCCPYCGGKRVTRNEIVEVSRERNAITGNLKKVPNRYMACEVINATVIYAQFVCKKCGELTEMERIEN